MKKEEPQESEEEKEERLDKLRMEARDYELFRWKCPKCGSVHQFKANQCFNRSCLYKGKLKKVKR